MKKGRLFVAAGLFAVATAASVFTLANTSNRLSRTSLDTSISKVSTKEIAQRASQDNRLFTCNVPEKANTKRIWKDSDTGWTVFGVTTGISVVMIGIMVFLKFKNKKDKGE